MSLRDHRQRALARRWRQTQAAAEAAGTPGQTKETRRWLERRARFRDKRAQGASKADTKRPPDDS